ncbi:MAG: NusG domain II-containing protein [Clostridia bacterium]|nr:NusG domain II-containing protein [Clostridia bacterium]
MKKADFIVLGFVVGLLLVWGAFTSGGEKVSIYVDGEVYKTLSLKENAKVKIETEYGKTTVVIDDGRVYIKETSCPNKLCQKGEISKAGQSIVCLPNRVSVLVEGKTKETEADVLL